MSHPFFDRTKSNQQRATARYGESKAGDLRAGPLIADAEKNPKLQVPDESYNGAPARQICDTGEVKGD